MRDKKNVDAYKASIKNQLSNAGLIRGQPRHSPISPPAPRAHPRHSITAPKTKPKKAAALLSRTPRLTPPPQLTVSDADFSGFSPYTEASFLQHDNGLLALSMPDPNDFDQFSSEPFGDVDFTSFDPNMSFPFASTSMNGVSSLMMDPLFDNPASIYPSLSGGGGYPGDPTAFPTYPGPQSSAPMFEDLVMLYFSQVSGIQFTFAGAQLRDVTMNAVQHEPRGACAFAISALADFHQTQMRIAQGLEAPQSNQNSHTHYLYGEALSKLNANRDNGNGWSESDALAALHLVSFAHLSGGSADWQEPFDILCAWLMQSNLSVSVGSAAVVYQGLPPTSQLLVRMIMWLDIFSSLSLKRVPKFLNLWKSLLNVQSGCPSILDMSSLTGCAEDTLLAIGDISQLANWKTIQQRNGTLSYPELVRRGKAIEDEILHRQGLHAKLTPTFGPITVLQDCDAPTEAHRDVCVSLFRESALLYLHTVMSDSSPVPEISQSVNKIVKELNALPPSNLDRALVFPICLSGCMTNDSTMRDFLKNRLQCLDDIHGNLLQTRLLMETLWQRRDVGGGFPNLREIIKEQSISLLLI